MKSIAVGVLLVFGVYAGFFLWLAHTKAICGPGSLIIFPWMVTGIPWVWAFKSWFSTLLTVPDAEGQLCVPLSAMGLLVFATGINVALVSWLLFNRKPK